jgi:hypothetical protein
MRMRTLICSLSLATAGALAVLAPGAARAEKFVIDDDTFLNIGLLLQPQVTFGENGTPNRGWNSDFLLRRGRIVLSGQVDSHIGFVLITDMPSWGKGGEYNQPFIIQDALASYKFGPELTIDAGFMLLPFVRNNYVSAGGLNTVDFHSLTIKFPTGRAFRDMGVEARGLLLDDKIYYRAGIFQGIASKAAVTDPAAPVPAINDADAPRVTANVRYNIAGKEDAYAFPGIYFAKDPVINVGVGVDWQHESYGPGSQHLGLSADVFVEYPTAVDQELVAAAAFMHYEDAPILVGGVAGIGHEAANAYYVEAGYRVDVIEPVVSLESFDGDKTLRLSQVKAGVNWWVTQHRYNIKAEISLPFNEESTPPATPVKNDKVVTLQTQMVF